MNQLLKYARDHGMLLQPGALELICQQEDPQGFLEKLCCEKDRPLFLGPAFVQEFISAQPAPPDIPVSPTPSSAASLSPLPPPPTPELQPPTSLAPPPSPTPEPQAPATEEPGPTEEEFKAARSNFRKHILELIAAREPVDFKHTTELEFDITGNSTCEGELSDFLKYFSSRYEKLFRLLKQRSEFQGAVQMKRVSWSRGEVAAIGIISELRETSWGATILKLEDRTGTVNVQLNDETTHLEDLLTDEVVGVLGAVSKDGRKVFANQIVHPDVPYRGRSVNRASRDVCVAFLSDIHFGSNTFLHEDWERFLSWVNLEDDFSSEEKELARKLRYIVIPGDLVDGIGIYPGQDKELDILDIYDQYAHAAEELSYIPEHIQLIIQPGNHDCVRLAEPQPALPERVQELFKRKNLHFFGSPAEFLLEGVRILSYHGKSLGDFDKAVKDFKMKDPMPIMRSIIRRRHIAPIYGASTPLAPEHQDYMVIKNIPDIFVTGHVHSAGSMIYKGVLLLNASCWQAQTAYQKMMNFVPDPAKVPVVNLQSFETTMLNFQSEEEREKLRKEREAEAAAELPII